MLQWQKTNTMEQSVVHRAKSLSVRSHGAEALAGCRLRRMLNRASALADSNNTSVDAFLETKDSGIKRPAILIGALVLLVIVVSGEGWCLSSPGWVRG